jgi:2-dehydro-3-deoxygluconokinase
MAARSAGRVSVDVLCVGETMAAVAPADGAGIEAATSFVVHPAGAESNVAHALAGLGHTAGWVSALGVDPLGNRILAELRASGVDVSLVRRNEAPTGVMVKDPGAHGSSVSYYRRGSAAAAMGPELIIELSAAKSRIVHLTGITPALSDSCAELVQRIMVDRSLAPTTVSFDVNFRAQLWPARRAAEVLLELARAADVVFVGLDEAAALWTCGSPDEVRALLPDVATLLVKDAEVGATAFVGATEHFLPSPRVAVVEHVGAGDAFAAGWLAGTLRGLAPESGLRLAHLSAASVLLSANDHGVPPTPADIAAVLALDAEEWQGLRLPAALQGLVGAP